MQGPWGKYFAEGASEVLKKLFEIIEKIGQMHKTLLRCELACSLLLAPLLFIFNCGMKRVIEVCTYNDYVNSISLFEKSQISHL